MISLISFDDSLEPDNKTRLVTSMQCILYLLALQNYEFLTQ